MKRMARLGNRHWRERARDDENPHRSSACLPTLRSGGARCRKSPTCQFLDPGIGPLQPFLERNRRLPAEHFPQLGIIRVAAADPLWTGDVLLRHANASDLRDDVDQLVDGHHAVLPQIQRLRVVGVHKSSDSANAVVDEAEGTSLLTISPNFDLVRAGELRHRHLSTDRRRGLFPTAVPGAERTEDIVEADYSGLHTVLFAVVRTEPLRDQLLPAVGILWLCGIGVFLPKRRA